MLWINLEGQNREATGKFEAKPLKHLSWRGLIRPIFQQIQHINCSCGQREFPSPDALIRHIERSHPEDKDSVRFSVRTTGSIKFSFLNSDTVKRKIWRRNIFKRILFKCGKKFECLTQGVFVSGSLIKVYSNDMVVCDACDKYQNSTWLFLDQITLIFLR